jgi:hypothetical protein
MANPSLAWLEALQARPKLDLDRGLSDESGEYNR